MLSNLTNTIYNLFTHCLFQCVINFTCRATMLRSVDLFQVTVGAFLTLKCVNRSTTLRNLQTLRYKSLPCGNANKIFVSFIQEVLATTTTIFHLTVIISTCISCMRYTSSNSTTVHETFISVHTTRHLAHFPPSQEVLLHLFSDHSLSFKKSSSIESSN